MNEKQGQEQIPGSQPNGTAGLLDAVTEIGKARANILALMKAALLRGDDSDALEHARELTGLPRKNVASSNPAE